MNNFKLNPVLDGIKGGFGDWHENQYLKTIEGLHNLMAEQYKVVYTVSNNSKHQLALDKRLKSEEIGITRKTTIALKVVKTTFPSIDRKRASAYGIVLNNAIEEGIKPKDFLTWLNDPKLEGEDATTSFVGLEGKRAKAARKPDDDNDEKGGDNLTGEDVVMTLPPFDRVKALDETPITGSIVLLIGRVNSLQETEVITLLDNSVLVNQALDLVKSKHKESPINHPPLEDDSVIKLVPKPAKKTTNRGRPKGSKNKPVVSTKTATEKKTVNEK